MAFYAIADAARRDFAAWLEREARARGAAGGPVPRAGPRRCSSPAAAAPATRSAARRPTAQLGPDLTHLGSRHVARRRHPAQQRRHHRRLDRRHPAHQARQQDAVVQHLHRASSCARSPPTSRASNERRPERQGPEAGPASSSAPRRSACSRSGRRPRAGATGRRSTTPRSGSGTRSRPSCSSSPPACSALLMRYPARGAEQRLPLAGGLQPGLHDARLGDDVPRRRAVPRGGRDLLPAADAGRARPAVPAALGLRLLVLRDRRRDGLRQHLLPRRARRRLVHVPAAHQLRATRPASAPTSGCSASRSSRSPRSPPRSS